MTRGRIWVAAIAAGMALAGCGSDDEGEPIPQDIAAEIEAQLDNIEGQIEEGSLGACNDIKKPGNTFDAVQAAVERVPERVDPDVRDALSGSVDRLDELIDQECSSREPEEPEPVPEETETVTVPEETEPEETEPEETVPEETAPEETVPSEEEPGLGPPGGTPPGQGGGSGGVPAPGDD
jgi:hypothetical protein